MSDPPGGTALVQRPVPPLPSRSMDINRLEDVALSDADGKSHRLGDLWADRPVILVFLRHFG